MTVSWLKVVGVVLTVFATKASAATEFNALQYYCHGDGIEFERSTKVGLGTRVYFNQGSYSYVKAPYPVTPSKEFIKQHVVNDAGVPPECAEFLLSKGDNQYKDGILARVHFKFDSSQLTSQSRYILDQMLTSIESAGNLEVEGHTDSMGSESYNFSLGVRRSAAVASYLNQHGIPLGGIDVLSKGELDPISDNQSESGRYLNRRVDIK